MNTNFLNSAVAAAVAQASQNVENAVDQTESEPKTPSEKEQKAADRAFKLAMARAYKERNDKIKENKEMLAEMDEFQHVVPDIQGKHCGQTARFTGRDLGGMKANTSAYPMYNPTTPKNLLGYTEDFTNAAWNKVTSTTITATAEQAERVIERLADLGRGSAARQRAVMGLVQDVRGAA